MSQRVAELPPDVGRRAREIREGRAVAAAPRDAATVVLLRGGNSGAGIEVYMLRRKPTMPFAPGAHVFPGGSVDPRDAERSVPWSGPSPRRWSELLDVPVDLASALVCAAVRETFEESGVLLAGSDPDTVVADTRGEDWEADRRALIDHSVSLAELLDHRGLVLRSDLLAVWAHWITPEIDPKRYDTRFFLALLPEGQQTRDVGGEADAVAWLPPAEAIDAARRGRLQLMPPTATTLAELAEYQDVADAFRAAAGREIVVRLPFVEIVDGRFHLVVPDGIPYPL